MGKLRWDSLCLMFSLLLKKEHDFQENENIALRFLDKKELKKLSNLSEINSPAGILWSFVSAV